MNSGAKNSPADEEGLAQVTRIAEDAKSRFRSTLGLDRPADGPLRVLCVDDSSDAADTLAAVLNLLGCDVRVCYDGPSALAEADDFGPDVCMLDLSMPGMDGLQLASALKKRRGTQPLYLVATTGLGEVEERTWTALAGFHFHLVKPIPPDALNRTLDAIRAAMRPPGVTSRA